MASGPRKASVLKESLPPVIKTSAEQYGYLVRYRVVSEDKNRFSSWSPVYTVNISEPSPIVAAVATNGNIAQVIWETNDETQFWDIFVGFGFEISHKQLIDNVATITTVNPHGLTNGSMVIISGLGDPFDGTFGILSVDSENTFSYYLVSPDIAYHSDHGIARAYYYFGSTSSNQYNFLINPNAEDLRVNIQISSINNDFSDFLTVFESDPIAL